MANKKKHPGGRPTDYRPEYCELLKMHLKDGYSFESFGAEVDCSKQTLYDWCDAHPEFLDAKAKGTSHCQKYWERVGKEGLYNETIKDGDGMTVTRSINASIWIFNMKNRFGWRDKQRDEDEPSKNQSSFQLSPSELVALVKSMRENK